MAPENSRILIVDDNEDILFMLKTMFQFKGFNVTIKESAENIEPYIEELMPDLILMDMLLSGIDGTEVCKKIKEIPAIAHIPVIMISALPQADVKCLDAGANYFLGKPFEMSELFATVAKAMKQD